MFFCALTSCLCLLSVCFRPGATLINSWLSTCPSHTNWQPWRPSMRPGTSKRHPFSVSGQNEISREWTGFLLVPRYNAVWIIFFILGLGTLLPWNFFMTATMVSSLNVNIKYRMFYLTVSQCIYGYMVFENICTQMWLVLRATDGASS